MLDEPSDEVLEWFGARVVESLGGRLNKHWLVQVGHEQLVLRRWSQPLDEIRYEARLLERLLALGWPVAPIVEEPVEVAGWHWSLTPFLRGEPAPTDDPIREQRERGRLLAQLHADLASIDDLGQRGRWRRCEEILSDVALDRALDGAEAEQPEEVCVLRWHLHRARARIDGLGLRERPGLVIHGDFTPWNLRFHRGRLSGVLDFELAHWDHRVADFALSWRGKHDSIIHAYAEVSPLDPEEWEMLTPMWWAYLIEGACHLMAQRERDDGWIMRQLLRRSPLMGPDATPFR